jgi:hypothetical protein
MADSRCHIVTAPVTRAQLTRIRAADLLGSIGVQVLADDAANVVLAEYMCVENHYSS